MADTKRYVGKTVASILSLKQQILSGNSEITKKELKSHKRKLKTLLNKKNFLVFLKNYFSKRETREKLKIMFDKEVCFCTTFVLTAVIF